MLFLQSGPHPAPMLEDVASVAAPCNPPVTIAPRASADACITAPAAAGSSDRECRSAATTSGRPSAEDGRAEARCETAGPRRRRRPSAERESITDIQRELVASRVLRRRRRRPLWAEDRRRDPRLRAGRRPKPSDRRDEALLRAIRGSQRQGAGGAPPAARRRRSATIRSRRAEVSDRPEGSASGGSMSERAPPERVIAVQRALADTATASPTERRRRRQTQAGDREVRARPQACRSPASSPTAWHASLPRSPAARWNRLRLPVCRSPGRRSTPCGLNPQSGWRPMSAAATGRGLSRRCAGVAPKRRARSSSSSTGSTAPPSCSARRRRPRSTRRIRSTAPSARLGNDPVPEQKVEERLAREIRFDPDAWIIEVEDEAGRHFLDNVVA